MKAFRLLPLIITIILFPGIVNLQAQDAKTILYNMDNVMLSFKDKQGKVKIILTNKSGKEKIREAIMMQKEGGFRLYRYTQPESQAGIATLSLPDGVMWLYMPAYAKPRKITLLAKSQAFTGTDFSYEDMEAKPFADRYTPKLLETKDDAFLLELTPISDKSKYSKIVLTVDKKNYYPVLMEYFNRKDRKFKEATYQYEVSGKYWYAEEVLMTDLKKEHSTKIIMTDVVFDQGLSDEVFTVEKLKQ